MKFILNSFNSFYQIKGHISNLNALKKIDVYNNCYDKDFSVHAKSYGGESLMDGCYLKRWVT